MHGLVQTSRFGRVFVWGGKQKMYRQQYGNHLDESDDVDGRTCGLIGIFSIRASTGALSSARCRAHAPRYFDFGAGSGRHLGRILDCLGIQLRQQCCKRRLWRPAARLVRLGNAPAGRQRSGRAVQPRPQLGALGHAGPAGIGAVVVWAHHVGKIVGQENGKWIIQSGNDGNRVRARALPIGNAIAIRWG